jgi:erythromycin esterase
VAVSRVDPGPSYNAADAQFVEWARNSRVVLSTVEPGPPWDDLAPLGKMISGATVVALSEGVHYAAEPLQFRNRVVQYLVQEKGFTAVAIESGIVESQVVHEYVRGGPGRAEAVLEQGIGWTFDRLPQNRALVEWLRAYNADKGNDHKANFYGFDVPGSAGNPKARRGVDTALVEALRYLASVDRVAADRFHADLDPILPNLRFDPHRSPSAAGYDRLGQSERDALTAGIAQLIALLDRREAHYVATGGAQAYQWGHRAAIGARQVDSWLRQIPHDWRPSSAPLRLPNDNARFLLTAEELRDRAQADNLEWIVQQEGPSGRILVYGHRYHLSAAPVKRSYGERGDSHHEAAGTYLRRRFGARLVTIGNLIDHGEFGGIDYTLELGRPAADSIDYIGSRVGDPMFLLDLRTAPPAVAGWLSRERAREHSFTHGSQVFQLSVGKAFDILFYLDTITPACTPDANGRGQDGTNKQ